MIGGGKDLNPVEMESQRGEYVLAHNGWVMNADPLINFAAEGSQVKLNHVLEQHTYTHPHTQKVCIQKMWFSFVIIIMAGAHMLLL